MPYTLLQGGRRRRRRRLGPAAAAIVLGVVATLLLAPSAGRGPLPRPVVAEPAPLQDTGTAPLAGGGAAPSPLAIRLEDPRDIVGLTFRRPPRSGLLFDLDSGRVLWRQRPERVLPIASLTKMMTALVVVDRVREGAHVRITRESLAYRGSGVGLLPRGKWIGVSTMLHGLLLPSGNDAAIALAQRAAGTVPRFVRLMNAKARAMGLTCTRFSSPHGLSDRGGDQSCTPDLAVLARAVLRERRLARIVRRRSAVLPFPVKGGKLYLYNSNPLLRTGYRGTTGLKTGYTRVAGRCLVATARRGRLKLGVVLLNSRDPGTQAQKLLDRGFARLSRR